MSVQESSSSDFISRALRKSFIYMARFVWAKSNYYFRDFAKIHYFIEQKILEFKKNITIVCVPRGYGKSKLVSVLFAIWSAFMDNRRYIMLVSFSQEKSCENLSDIIHLIETEQFKKFFPWRRGSTWRPSKPSGRIEIELLDNYGRVKSTVIIRAIGSMQQVVGASSKESRPDLVIWDDLEDPEKSIIKEQVEKLERWINKSALPGISVKDREGRKGQVVWVGTPHGNGCMLDRAMSRKWQRDVTVVKIPAITDFFLMDKELIDYLGLPEGKSIFEELISTEDILKKKDDYVMRGDLASFQLEYMMDSSIDKKLRFDAEKNRFITSAELVKLMPECTKIICIIDMAYTQKTYSDFVGINVTAHFPRSRMVVLRGVKYKFTQNELYDYLLKLREDFLPFRDRIEFYSESIAIQLIQGFWDERNIREGGPGIEILPIKENTKMNKTNRIIRLISFHNAGLLDFVNEECPHLLAEMAMFDGSKGTIKRAGTDDALDSFAYQPDFAIGSVPEDEKEIIVKVETNWEISERYFKEQAEKKKFKHSSFYNGF